MKKRNAERQLEVVNQSNCFVRRRSERQEGRNKTKINIEIKINHSSKSNRNNNNINKKMRRVKESYFREHPEWSATEGCSGAKEFEGEDLGNF